VGSKTPGTIGLTQAELDNVTAGVLRIGSNTAGNINVTTAIFSGPGWDTLALINNGTITETAAGSLNFPNLRVSSAGPVLLTSVNDIGALAASTTGSFSFDNGSNFLVVGVIDGVTGISTNGSDIHLIADGMDLEQAVTTGSSSAGVVDLEPFTANLTVIVGGINFLDLDLTSADLNEVTAGVLRIGSSSFIGSIVITAAINPVNVGALSLQTTGAGTIAQTSTISVDSGTGGLAVQAQTAVALNQANDVGVLAALVTGAGHGFSFTNSHLLTIGTVDGVSGVHSANNVIND